MKATSISRIKMDILKEMPAVQLRAAIAGRGPRMCWLMLCALGVTAAGCQRQLMPTPNLYSYMHDNAFDRVPAEFRNNHVDVLYVTDRLPSGTGKTGPTYGYGRSHALAFGSCTVEIGRDVSWDELVRASRTVKRSVSLPLAVKQVREIARCPEIPFPALEKGPPLVEDPAVLAEFAAVAQQLQDEIAARLAHSTKKDVYLYVHGFNNTFEDAVFTSAELWHFLGRQGVPICYTWPAGRGLSASGYVYDSVSCEFTVFHLKQLLRALGRCPEIEKVHILAHSRGTDVASAALRELKLEYTHAETSVGAALKLGNVVLAAPDMDLDVVQERIGGERLAYAPERFTIYTSPADRALALADMLTLGIERLGQVQPSQLTPRLRKVVAMVPVSYIEALVHTGYIGHSYFTDSPAVASDLILLLRDNCPPGADHGRPLNERITNFWELRDDYLQGNKRATASEPAAPPVHAQG
jgi:esterase/lipase superfamily enzyme